MPPQSVYSENCNERKIHVHYHHRLFYAYLKIKLLFVSQTKSICDITETDEFEGTSMAAKRKNIRRNINLNGKMQTNGCNAYLKKLSTRYVLNY